MADKVVLTRKSFRRIAAAVKKVENKLILSNFSNGTLNKFAASQTIVPVYNYTGHELDVGYIVWLRRRNTDGIYNAYQLMYPGVTSIGVCCDLIPVNSLGYVFVSGIFPVFVHDKYGNISRTDTLPGIAVNSRVDLNANAFYAKYYHFWTEFNQVTTYHGPEWGPFIVKGYFNDLPANQTTLNNIFDYLYWCEFDPNYRSL